MEGRLENELKITKAIDKKIQDMPDCVKKWHKSLYASDNTAATRMDMINKIHRFIVFINGNEIIKNFDCSKISEDLINEYFISIKTKTNRNGEKSSTSDSYQQSTYCAIKNFMDFLFNHNYISHNYINGIKKPKNKDLERINASRAILTEKDFKLIMHLAYLEKNPILRSRDCAILSLFMTTGMRKTALKSINISDIDFNDNTLLVYDKNDTPKFYVLSKETMTLINNWISVRSSFSNNILTDALFISYQGNRMCENSISKVVMKYSGKAIGKQYRPHKLRSGYCSILYSKTKDIEFVRRAVKHANSQTTQRYIVVENDAQVQASKIMGSIL